MFPRVICIPKISAFVLRMSQTLVNWWNLHNIWQLTVFWSMSPLCWRVAFISKDFCAPVTNSFRDVEIGCNLWCQCKSDTGLPATQLVLSQSSCNKQPLRNVPNYVIAVSLKMNYPVLCLFMLLFIVFVAIHSFKIDHVLWIILFWFFTLFFLLRHV